MHRISWLTEKLLAPQEGTHYWELRKNLNFEEKSLNYIIYYYPFPVWDE